MKKQTILLVDDDPDYLETNRAVLEAKGFDVHTAETTEQALKLARSVNPAIAILDVIMDEPDSGFKLARQIRGSRETRNVRIVLLTALNDVNREKGVAYRFSDGDRDGRDGCRRFPGRQSPVADEPRLTVHTAQSVPTSLCCYRLPTTVASIVFGLFASVTPNLPVCTYRPPPCLVVFPPDAPAERPS